ncbi:scavenger receptor cysteine-rich domain superfamily protein-like [Diadema antillarum]|uniref:scavenger receptor cysteine-rich domain superfamily protein-like n=1 Tax=Diadema antillarum TaxID=105358 RepID=UPI003A888D06
MCLLEIADWSLQLVGGSSKSEGRVEVFLGGVWGTICHNMWDHEDAMVVCRELGYLGADMALVAGEYGSGQNIPLLFNVRCNGTESHLSECPRTDVEMKSGCGDGHTAGVKCTSTGNLRLANGSSPFEGRLEILGESGEWGTICDSGWDLTDAGVACKELGFHGALKAYTTSDLSPTDPFFGPGSGPILLSGLACKGNERFLRHCPASGREVLQNCSHRRDAGMECDSKRGSTPKSDNNRTVSNLRAWQVVIIVIGVAVVAILIAYLCRRTWIQAQATLRGADSVNTSSATYVPPVNLTRVELVSTVSPTNNPCAKFPKHSVHPP